MPNGSVPKSLPAADLAYAHLRGRLLDGAYPGGELLSEGSVAAELGISRTPSGRPSCAWRPRGSCACTRSAARWSSRSAPARPRRSSRRGC
ncbi:hypothetical protein ACFQZC_33185 [Streptacidiphilus monticola]